MLPHAKTPRTLSDVVTAVERPNDTGERPPPETGSRKLRHALDYQGGPDTAAQDGGSAPPDC
jgi:hypothetical protein